MAIGTGFGSEVAKGMGYKEASKAMQYQPTSRVATDVLAGLEQAPKTITGSHMGFGPLPETWITGFGNISPSDVQVMGKRAIETGRELRAIPEDFANAQSGVIRQNYKGEPTYGARIQGVADDIGDVMARQQARRSSYETSPRSSVEVFGDMVPDSKLYAVRNTGEGQMLRPTTSPAGVEHRGVDYGETEDFLREISPALSVNKPEDIIDMYERTYMSENTPAVRKLNEDWEKFQTDRIKDMYPSHFSKAESFKALRSGYPANVIQDMKLKWFQDYINEKKAQGFEIPSMEEYFARAQSAHTLTKKIIPNIIQKYIGTPNDPFLESAKQGFTMTPADEFVSQYLDTPSSLETARREAGFEPKGEVADKLMPVAESKLTTQNAELDKLIADQAEVGRTEGIMVPYPDGRVDPATGAVELATNPNYAQYTNKIGAMRKVIEETEQEINNLKLAQAYENVSDSSIKKATAVDYRNRIPAEYQQFYPALYSEKPKTTAISPTEYKTPDTAPFFETNVHGLTRAGILPLAKDLVKKIMSGEIPPDQVPSLSQPHTITKFMKDIVAPRIEKEKAAKLAMKDYKVNVEKHFVDVVNAIPDSMKVGTNAKLLWLDNATPVDEIYQSLSDETFVLDHCIGNSGNGRGLKNLFTGDERAYIPYLDPVTGQTFKNAGSTSSYMDDVVNAEKDIMMLRDIKTGMPVGTIELSRDVDQDGEVEYQIGYVSGYKNHSNKFGGIDPKYREALRDALNLVGNEIAGTSGNETRSGVFDMRDRGQLNELRKKLDLPKTHDEFTKAWAGVQKNLMDNLDGDRYITLDQAEEAVKEYKQANPPVPAVRSGFPPSGKDVIERNIIMQGLSRENLDPTRQFNAARLVTNNSRFVPYPTAESEMDLRPFRALRTILDEEKRRSDEYSVSNPLGAFSDYQLFRNLQNMVDAIDQGDMRFADFGLNGASELLDLRAGLQKQADAIGQLAHYADVLQRNGFRSPLPSEQTGAPEWNTYQRYIGELGIDNPRDLRTRLEDTINHADLREIDPQLDEIQRANFRHLLEIHSRAVKQAIDHPAPTAPAEQRGIPLAQWSDLVGQTMDRIQADHGQTVRDRVAGILAEAIGSQMDIPANERPNQVSSFLANARSANNSQQVRSALRTLGSAIDQANADILNARNAPAPAPTTALPTSEDFRNALLASMNEIPANTWTDVYPVYERVRTEIENAGGLHYQQPLTVVNRLNEEANFYEGDGEPATAHGLRMLANRIARLVPENPPASMALANQNAVRNQPTRQLVAGQEALSNSIIDVMNDEPSMAPAISDRLTALQWRENLVNDPAGLVRNLRIEADAEANAGDERFASSLYDIANLIADERGETLFTPAGRQLQAPTQSSRDLAISTEEQRNTNRVEQVVALTDAIDRQLEEIASADRYGLMGLVDRYENPNDLPDSITDHTNSFDDAIRIARFLEQHAQARLDAMPPERNMPTAAMETPRDVAMSIGPNQTHQSLTQRQAQVQALTEGINNELRTLTNNEASLRQAQLFYQDYDNLPLEMTNLVATEEDANRVLQYIQQHVQNRLANLNQPQNQPQSFNEALNRVADEIRNTYTDSYIRQFQIGDMDVRRNVLQDVADRPAVYGMARANAETQRLIVDRLRNEGLPEQQAQLPTPVEQQNQRISDAITQRSELVNQNHLGISQRFDTIVRVAANEANPQTDTVNFISSLHHRANSVDRVGDREATILANHLRNLASDVNDALQRQAPALPAPDLTTAPDPIQADLDRLYNSVSESIRTRHPTMIDSVMNSRNTRSNLADVIRTDPIRYGLENYSPDVVNQVVERIIEDGLSNGQINGQMPAPVERPRALRRVALGNEPDPVAQHFERVEQGVNQPAGYGALNAGERGTVILYSTNLLNGDRNATAGLAPAERQMIEVLTRYREPEPTLINELVHRRLINTLTSETYNPATDGEALIRLANTRSGMFDELGDATREQVKDIINKWNFTRFPNYRPPEEGMGLEPEGRKRGGFIRKRKMNEGGEPPKLTPYEQFKIDNAERIRQGNELNENRNKYDPYKGSDKPIPTQRSAPRGASGSAGVIPSGSGPSYLDRPRLYSIGGKVYMDVGGQVKPVPNIPTTPEKTRPNPTDHVIKRPVDEGFREIYEKYRNPPKPSGSAGTMPSGSGASYLDRPHLYADGGRIRMGEGGAPDFEGSYYMHPSVQRLVASGEISHGDTRWMSDYASTKGSTTAEGKGAWKDQSERMQNLVGRMERGEIPIPKHMQGPEGVRVGGNSSGLNPNGAGGVGGGGGRADVPRGGSGGGGGGATDIKQFMNPRNIAYQDGGNVNIDAMRLALMKG
jgi:hypothetical protein